MRNDILRQIANVVTFAITLFVNFLANALPLNGQTSAEIANRLPILFVPANYVFGIWGIIYTFLIGFTIYQALPAQRENPYLRRIGPLFVVANLANASWLFAFHYNQFALSMIPMVILLLTLIAIYLRTENGMTRLKGAAKWLIHVPFSIYLGWITVATVANAAYILYDANWDGFGIAPEVWTVALLLIAGAITLRIILTRSDIAYTAVIVWALAGIVVKQSATPSVAITAAILAILLPLVLIYTRIRPDSKAPVQMGYAQQGAGD